MMTTMEVTKETRAVAIFGLLLVTLLFCGQVTAVLFPHSQWVIENVYGGDPTSSGDPTAYFAYHQGWAWADTFFWAPLQFAGSIGMLQGKQRGFLLALMASVPFWYSSISIFIWDRDMGRRENTFMYWVIIWGMWPAFGILEGIYCFRRLQEHPYSQIH